MRCAESSHSLRLKLRTESPVENPKARMKFAQARKRRAGGLGLLAVALVLAPLLSVVSAGAPPLEEGIGKFGGTEGGGWMYKKGWRSERSMICSPASGSHGAGW
jgi:hypothetical protein